MPDSYGGPHHKLSWSDVMSCVTECWDLLGGMRADASGLGPDGWVAGHLRKAACL